jgi:hypothetical protein
MSNARNEHWLLVWSVAAVLCASGWFAFERYWRAEGYAPTIMDSTDLWAQARDRVSKAEPPIRVALLGASRIQYGISPRAFVDEIDAIRLHSGARYVRSSVDVAMLSVNGHYPLAALRDLAEDDRFRGVAIIGVDARGFQKRHREMQSKWIHFYRHDWTPARDLHRSLLTAIQPHAIAARPDFSWSNLLARYLNGYGPPSREYVTFYADRSGGTDYSRSDIELVRKGRVRDLREYYATTPPISADEWMRDNEEVIDWVRRINARGGRVVFYREPVSGEHLDLDEARFPRNEFWDALAKTMPATMIDFRDYPELNIPTPDTSHIDARDIDRHTRALVRVLASKGVFAKR